MRDTFARITIAFRLLQLCFLALAATSSRGDELPTSERLTSPAAVYETKFTDPEVLCFIQADSTLAVCRSLCEMEEVFLTEILVCWTAVAQWLLKVRTPMGHWTRRPSHISPQWSDLDDLQLC